MVAPPAQVISQPHSIKPCGQSEDHVGVFDAAVH
jgi:hypothetical protein